LIVEQNFELITAPATEHVQVTALRISPQLLAHHRHQTCDLSAHIAGAGVEEDANRPMEPDHRSLSSACSHGAIAPASHVPANARMRPFGNVPSTRRSVAACWGWIASRTATGTKPPLPGRTCGSWRSGVASFARQ